MTSRSFSTKYLSLDSLKVRSRWGLSSWACQIALHGGVTHACMLGHGARRPVGGLLGGSV